MYGRGSGRIRRLSWLVIAWLTVATAVPVGAIARAEGAAMQWLPLGGRIDAFRMVSTGAERLYGPSGIGVIVFWATWSPTSIAALKDILSDARSSRLHWSVLPINVDEVSSPPERYDKIVAVLREEVGYRDTVWVDPGRETFARWGVVTVPTIVLFGLDRRVVAAERGWSAPVRERVQVTLGAVESSVGDAVPDTALRRRGLFVTDALRSWRAGRILRASRDINSLRRTNPGWAMPRVISAHWCWETGDTTCARRAAEAAIMADSTDSWALATLAAVELRHGHQDVAAQLARRAIANDSTLTPAWRLLAQAALAAGNEEEARGAWEMIGHLNPSDPAYDMIAAVMYERQGKIDSALVRWRRAVDRGHD